MDIAEGATHKKKGTSKRKRLKNQPAEELRSDSGCFDVQIDIATEARPEKRKLGEKSKSSAKKSKKENTAYEEEREEVEEIAAEHNCIVEEETEENILNHSNDDNDDELEKNCRHLATHVAEEDEKRKKLIQKLRAISTPPSQAHSNSGSVEFFVANLPGMFKNIKDDVEKFFKERGVNIFDAQGQKRPYCYCYVPLGQKEKMKALHGTEFEGLKLRIEVRAHSGVKPGGKPSRVAFLQCKPDVVQLNDLLKATGARDGFILSKKRVAFLNFDDAYEAKKYLDQGQVTVNGCTMTLESAKPRPAWARNGPAKRMCYTCRDTGHISSACPQGVDTSGGSRHSRTEGRGIHQGSHRRGHGGLRGGGGL